MARSARRWLAVVLACAVAPPQPLHFVSLSRPTLLQELDIKNAQLLRFSADGRLLAWVEERGPIRIADLPSGKVRTVPFSTRDEIKAFHLRPDAGRAVVRLRRLKAKEAPR